jgi:hypothetical protein
MKVMALSLAVQVFCEGVPTIAWTLQIQLDLTQIFIQDFVQFS